jgi:hypothetical protein
MIARFKQSKTTAVNRGDGLMATGSRNGLISRGKYWDSIIVTCGEVVGKQYSYMWRSNGRAVQSHVE